MVKPDPEDKKCSKLILHSFFGLLNTLFIHFYQECVTLHQVPKLGNKAIVVITERGHCFHDFLYI